MYDRVRALDVIERALDDDPYCPVCGAPTTIVDADGVLMLYCTATVEPSGLMARVSAAMLPHVRRQVLDLEEGLAA
jgi:hypothetical protein